MKVINSSGVNSGVQAGNSGRMTQMDSISKSIQNQIANAQKELQELSSNENLSMEDKMKKRQEIQQEITNLNQQLRQHQIEQRREQQNQNAVSNDTANATNKTSVEQGSSSADASMQAMLTADSAMKQAKVQTNVATQIKGKASVLESEIKTDHGRGAATEKKEEELANLQTKMQSTTTAQIASLANANSAMHKAIQGDSEVEENDNSKDGIRETKEKTNKMPEQKTEVSNKNKTTDHLSEEKATGGVKQMTYQSIDVRL